MLDRSPSHAGKVPAVTLGFWVIKIAATTLGETGGDTLSMSMGLGYAVSTVIVFAIFLLAAGAQIRARALHPFLYWATIVAATTAGTTMADFADRSLGIGYIGGSVLLFALLMAVLLAWWKTAGTVSVTAIVTPKAEAFYWAAIFASNTLGTALGDFLADDSGLGFAGGALVFASLLAIVAAGYRFIGVSHTLLFWTAFILTRPLGATVGDLLTKSHDDGGFGLSRSGSTAILAVFIVAGILFVRPRGPRAA